MKKYTLQAVLAILIALLAYFAGTRHAVPPVVPKVVVPEKPQSSEKEINLLLTELGKITDKPKATVRDITDYLREKYGPCWGVPEGQCRE